MKSNFVVIMAGGSGTRLWPKSRIKKPKQLYALVNNESMIKNTVKRLAPVVGLKNIYIATNALQTKDIARELPKLKHNLIIEPAIRNTAPSIGLAALKLKGKAEVIAFLPADHYIGKEKEFQQILEKAFEVAKRDYLTLIGIRPSDPDTGLGYIQMGKKIDKDSFEVSRFVEKPNLDTAKKYLGSGQYLWNGGMFIARPEVILNLFKKHAPIIFRGLLKNYERLPNISFDYAIAEKAKNVAVIPGDFAWSDIGNWKKLFEMLSKKEGDTVAVGCAHYGVDTTGCLIHGTDRLVATVGLKDIIVVDTPDVVLVCHKDKAQEVKKIVEDLKRQGKENYL